MNQTPPPLAAAELLEDYRKSIDHLDRAILAILAERFRLTEKIGLAKAALGYPAAAPEREQAQQAQYRQIALAYGLDAEMILDVMGCIVRHVKKRHQEITREE